jgi:hypothetical protein
VAATAGLTKGQTKFGRRDVNDVQQLQDVSCAELLLVQLATCVEPLANTDAIGSVRQSSWRSLAVGENFSNCRRKLIYAGARNNDAVSAAMSFLCDTQEPAALIFPELDVEVLALNLQFFRLDDVIHFALRAPSLGTKTGKWKKNQRS